MSRLAGLIVAIILLMSGCSAPAGNAEIVGDAARGEQLYLQPHIGTNKAVGCISCHALQPDLVIVGPSHADVGQRAETAVVGMSAEEYLTESIINPDGHIAEGFTPGIMYTNYANELSEQEIADLVAYMLTLR